MGEPWPPDPDDGPPSCDRCDTVVSHDYYRQWSDNDGQLDGCRTCLPRSIRYGQDLYDRDPDEIEFDVQVETQRKPAPLGDNSAAESSE